MKFKLYSILLALLILVILGLFYFNKEGFKSDYSDFTSIDRIKTNDGKYQYCVAGQVTCSSGNRTTISDDYNGGITYDASCSDGSTTDCSGNFVQHLTGASLQNWTTPTSTGLNFPFSTHGFTIPYSYIPIDISGIYIDFYDADGKLLDNMHKCDMLPTQYDADQCHAALTPKTDTPKSKTTKGKCIADYGTNVGDSLCCGQKGVLQKYASDYVCPKSTPTCSNFVCGQSYGTCK
uniref:Uncharacterized protein n=1 Tax=viral metagenome TaxID=1070528 RepID=A0A6C0D1F8_9ZZZZ